MYFPPFGTCREGIWHSDSEWTWKFWKRSTRACVTWPTIASPISSATVHRLSSSTPAYITLLSFFLIKKKSEMDIELSQILYNFLKIEEFYTDSHEWDWWGVVFFWSNYARYTPYQAVTLAIFFVWISLLRSHTVSLLQFSLRWHWAEAFLLSMFHHLTYIFTNHPHPCPWIKAKVEVFSVCSLLHYFFDNLEGL